MGRNGWYRAIVGGTALCVVAIAVTGAAFVRRDVHAEYVKYLSGKDTITGYLAYPERKDPAPAVVVIFEIFGMSDFVRQTTEQLARDGFVALAPDLLSRRGGTPPSTDDARKLIAGLNPDTLTLDLDATVAYLKTLKAVRGDRAHPRQGTGRLRGERRADRCGPRGRGGRGQAVREGLSLHRLPGRGPRI